MPPPYPLFSQPFRSKPSCMHPTPRPTGTTQVQRATSQLVSKYRAARKSIREAAEAAETVGERVIKGDELKVR